MSLTPNVPEMCRTWACVRANAAHVTAREIALLAAFAFAVALVLAWDEPPRHP